MIWVKTDAGRAEIQARAVVKERALRNLLLLIDGKTSDQTLVGSVAGVTAEHFQALKALGLIVPVTGSPSPSPSSSPSPSPSPARPASSSASRSSSGPATQPVDIDVGGLDFQQFRSAIGRLISAHLGFRGHMTAMVLDEAMTMDDLRDVAQRVIKQIEQRKGAQAAADARKALSGG